MKKAMTVVTAGFKNEVSSTHKCFTQNIYHNQRVQAIVKWF